MGYKFLGILSRAVRDYIIMDPLLPPPLPFSDGSAILAANTLGTDERTSDGLSEGASEGATTGASEGAVVGALEGAMVGAWLMPRYGKSVVVGTYEGKLLGATVLGCFFLG
jgi:hypothetical protein